MSDSQSCLRNKVAATSSWFPCPGPLTICLQSAWFHDYPSLTPCVLGTL